MLVFSPTGPAQQVYNMVPPPANHSKTENHVKCLLQEQNKRAFWLERCNIAFMLSAKQESCEYEKNSIYRYFLVNLRIASKMLFDLKAFIKHSSEIIAKIFKKVKWIAGNIFLVKKMRQGSTAL